LSLADQDTILLLLTVESAVDLGRPRPQLLTVESAGDLGRPRPQLLTVESAVDLGKPRHNSTVTDCGVRS